MLIEAIISIFRSPQPFDIDTIFTSSGKTYRDAPPERRGGIGSMSSHVSNERGLAAFESLTLLPPPTPSPGAISAPREILCK